MVFLASNIESFKPVKFLALNARDPSQTTSLRNQFVREMNKRWDHVRRMVKEAIVDEDVFGLDQSQRIRGLSLLSHTPGRRAFDFPRRSDKIRAFMDWLNAITKNTIFAPSIEKAGVFVFEQSGFAIENAWTSRYILSSYRKGVIRARKQMIQVGWNIPSLDVTGGIEASMASIIHADRVGILYTRAFNELKGITEAMDQVVSRALAEGLANGLHPTTIAKNINHLIVGKGGTLDFRDSLGRFIPAKRRAQILARTEIIRAHAEGQLQEFENFGLEGVSVKAEWITAGDNRVCNLCAGMEGSIFSIEQARGMIPLHAQCRCIWIPTPPL